MRHVLMDPRFPDIVGRWARQALNDNDPGPADGIGADRDDAVNSDPAAQAVRSQDP